MRPRLIYLHIPKTGGSSQRLHLVDLYRRENVFWFGLDDASYPGRTFDPERLRDYPVIGGHRPIGFYPQDLDALYIAVVREPVARVCSLFRHLTLSTGRDRVNERARKLALWRERGMDPDSIVHSLASCIEFRRQATDAQCGYLSRGTADFAGACATLRQVACAVAVDDRLPALNRRLGQLLQWPDLPGKHLNRSGPDSLEAVLREPGARAAIEALNREDLRLYEHIRNDHGGLYVNLADPARYTRSLASPQYRSGQSVAELGLRYLSLYSKGYAGVRTDGSAQASLVIVNTGPSDIELGDLPEVCLHYEVLAADGRLLHSGRGQGPARRRIPAGGQVLARLDIAIPREQRQVAASARIELMLDASRGVTALNPLHPATVSLVALDDDGRPEIPAATN